MPARRLAAMLVLLAALLLGPAEAQPGRAPLTGIPNLTVDYYDVSGRTGPEIRAAINRHPNRPRDPNDGEPMDALARWDYRWSWPGDGRGGCDLGRVSVQFSARVLMPRLADERAVPGPVLQRWRTYIAWLAAHEDGHVSFAYRAMPELLSALRRSSCARANADAETVLNRIRKHDVDFDRVTDHGRRQGVRFP